MQKEIKMTSEQHPSQETESFEPDRWVPLRSKENELLPIIQLSYHLACIPAQMPRVEINVTEFEWLIDILGINNSILLKAIHSERITLPFKLNGVGSQATATLQAIAPEHNPKKTRDKDQHLIEVDFKKLQEEAASLGLLAIQLYERHILQSLFEIRLEEFNSLEDGEFKDLALLTLSNIVAVIMSLMLAKVALESNQGLSSAIFLLLFDLLMMNVFEYFLFVRREKAKKREDFPQIIYQLNFAPDSHLEKFLKISKYLFIRYVYERSQISQKINEIKSIPTISLLRIQN